jgi:hypothetical protein
VALSATRGEMCKSTAGHSRFVSDIEEGHACVQLLPTIEVPWPGRQEVQGEASFTQFREAHYAD